MLDKSKVPDVAALDALLAIVKTALAAKVNTADIIDGLTSSDATKPLSAKQGKVLKDAVDTKQDIIQYSTMPTADQPYLGKVAQYVGATGLAYTKGSFYECKYDNDTTTYYWDVCEMTAELGTLSDGETKPVSGDVIYDALALKQDKALSSPVESQSTVEGALSALSSNKQASTLSTTIEGESTVEGALTALSNKSVGVDGTTIVKDQTTGELSAVTATNNSVGVVTDGDGTSIGANGEVNVVNRLEEISALPAASASNEGKFYLLTGTQSGYQTGGTYACEEITPATDPKTYHWVLKSANPLTFNSDNFTVANDEVSLKEGYKKIYVGTKADWDLLSTAEKIEYDEAHFTGDNPTDPSQVVDAVTDGDMRAVTSNAVYDAIADKANFLTGSITNGSSSMTITFSPSYMGRVGLLNIMPAGTAVAPTTALIAVTQFGATQVATFSNLIGTPVTAVSMSGNVLTITLSASTPNRNYVFLYA